MKEDSHSASPSLPRAGRASPGRKTASVETYVTGFTLWSIAKWSTRVVETTLSLRRPAYLRLGLGLGLGLGRCPCAGARTCGTHSDRAAQPRTSAERETSRPPPHHLHCSRVTS